MADISAAIRNAVGEKTAEIQRLADQLEDILYQAGLAQRRGSHKDSRCEDIKNIDTVVKILCHGYPLRALCNDWVV